MEKSSAAFHKDPVWWGICCAVLTLHIGSWWWTGNQNKSSSASTMQSVERIHLHTQAISPPSIEYQISTPSKKTEIQLEPLIVKAPLPVTPPKSAPKSNQTSSPTKPKSSKAPEPKKSSSPPPKKAKNSKKPPPPPNPAEQQKIGVEQALLAAAAATLSQLDMVAIQEAVPQKNVPSSLPQVMGDLKSQQLPIDSAASYLSQIAWKLKKTLRFPEYGSVKVEIYLSQGGQVERISVLTSENSKNRAYVETTLPTLSFPPPPNKVPINYIFLLNNE